MALIYTWSAILTKIQEDCDLISEPFISTDELLGYANEALESAETAVHTIGIEDTYFLAWDFIYLRPSIATYDPPANIYANKIRKMFYMNPPQTVVVNGTTVLGSTAVTLTSGTGVSRGMAVFGTGIPQTTKVRSITGTALVLSKAATASGTVSLTFVALTPVYGGRIYEVRKIRQLMDQCFSYTGSDYGFLIFNQELEEGGNQYNLFPTPQETGPLILVNYIREMRRLTSSLTDAFNVSELTECNNYLFQYMKWKVAIKRRIAELVAAEAATLEKEYVLLQQTFKEMVPDENNKVQMDLSAYFNQELDLYY